LDKLQSGINVMPLFFIALASAAPAGSAAPAKPEVPKMICHREEVTGSLARFRKICKTEAQWRGEADRAADTAGRLQENGLINSCASPPIGP
jgi:predicted secreted protein